MDYKKPVWNEQTSKLTKVLAYRSMSPKNKKSYLVVIITWRNATILSTWHNTFLNISYQVYHQDQKFKSNFSSSNIKIQDHQGTNKLNGKYTKIT